MNGELPALASARLHIPHARPGHEARTVDFFARNRDHFARWDPPAPADFYTVEYWERNLARAREDFVNDRGVRFDLFDAASGSESPLIGRMAFSQIARGPFQACVLGYQIDAAYEGRGLVRESLVEGIRYMFEVKRLHRIQANHLPENLRSAGLLKRLGFVQEGLAKDYLFIAGAWRDHVLNALTNADFDATSLTRT